MPRWDTLIKTRSVTAPPETAAGRAGGPDAGLASPRDIKSEPQDTDDLYARWALATGLRGYGRVAGWRKPKGVDGPIRIIARAPDLDALERALKTSKLKIPSFYKRVPEGATSRPLFFTAELELKDLPWLRENPLKLTWELAMPVRRAEDVGRASPGEFGPFRDEAALRPKALLKGGKRSFKATEPASLRSAIAVIDFGCPFLNERFEDADGQSRVAVLWDQDERAPDPTARWWTNLPRTKAYGRELSHTAMSRIKDEVRADPRLDEAQVYRSIDYLIDYDDPRRRAWFATHGAHVVDVAAGTHDPLSSFVPSEAIDTTKVDAAGEAPIIFVQLPALTAADSSGGSLSAHLLDGVRFALDLCEKGAPLVVNISYGSFAGPHNGSSMIERALDELLEKRPDNFAIVLGAGNARAEHCHTRRTVRVNNSALLRVVLPAGDTTDTFVELWYPRRKGRHEQLALRVRTADADWSPWVEPGKQVRLVDEASGEPLALLQHERNVPHGQHLAMALLSMVPTAHATDDEGPLNAPGLWEIEVRLANDGDVTSTREVTFDAWVERDDPGARGGADEQARFIGLRRGDEHNTLSSIATGMLTVVAGGYRWSDGSMADYSSLPLSDCRPTCVGSKHRALPMVFAACEEDEINPSVRAAAVRSADVHHMNGTSVAAPVVARRLFNHIVSAGTVTRKEWRGVLSKLPERTHHVVRLLAP
jgi:Subtilase family